MIVKINELENFSHFADDYFYDYDRDVILKDSEIVSNRMLLWDGKIRETAREYLKNLKIEDEEVATEEGRFVAVNSLRSYAHVCSRFVYDTVTAKIIDIHQNKEVEKLVTSDGCSVFYDKEDLKKLKNR